MSGWTPGPWRVAKSHELVDGTSVVNSDGDFVCYAGTQSQDDSVMADAHLIAAAPELYEALYNILDSKHPDVRIQPDHLSDAFKALAKARAESNG